MRVLERLLIFVLVLMVLEGRRPVQVRAFNLDTRVPQVIHGPEHSFFGYSVALWSDMTGKLSLVIGASRGILSKSANHSLPLGNIYLCQLIGFSGEYHCSVREDLPKLSGIDFSLHAVEWAKDAIMQQGIGFGETLHTPNRKKTVLIACAPRFPRKNYGKWNTQLQPRGSCYVIKSHLPNATVGTALPYPYVYQKPENGVAHRRQNDEFFSGFAEAGFSAAITMNEESLYLGGPKAFHGQGVTLCMGKRSGKWTRTKATRSTISFSRNLDDGLEGFAMVIGKFDGRTELIATSAPDNFLCRGSVKIYRPRLNMYIKELQGEGIGSKFGFSLAAGDFDHDGKDDLAVGAPLMSSVDFPDDIGKVFIYYSPANETNPLDITIQIKGREPWGRFGQSLTCPGDLDLDGYDDLVVGAPNTFDGQGTIYVYNGGPGGLQQNPSQVIEASEFPFRLSWFGFSLDGGLDMDGNGYPDLIIGAPGTNMGLFLRSGPVVVLSGGIEFESPLIALENPSCTVVLPNGVSQPVVCFNLRINLQYEAKHLSSPLPFQFDLEIDPYRHRVAFLKNHHHRYSVIQNVTHVDSELKDLELTIYVKPDVRDLKLNESVEASLEVSLVDSDVPRYPSKDSLDANGRIPPTSNLFNILSASSEKSFRSNTRFDCTNTTTCVTQSNLVLTAKEPEPLLVGEGSTTIEISLEVLENTAYLVTLELLAPSVLQDLHVQSDDYLPECQLNGQEGANNKFICTFPSTSEMPKDVRVSLSFTFNYHLLPLLNHRDSHFHFDFRTFSDTSDLQPSDNTLRVSVPKMSKVELQAVGVSNPDSTEGWMNESLSWNLLASPSFRGFISQQTPDKIGPMIIHRFDLVNYGPSPLTHGKIVLGLPLKLPYGLPALYIADPIKTSPNLTCSQPPLNPLNFRKIREEEEGNTSQVANEDLTDNEVPFSEEGDDNSSSVTKVKLPLLEEFSVVLNHTEEDIQEGRSRRRRMRRSSDPDNAEDSRTGSSKSSGSPADLRASGSKEKSGKKHTTVINCGNIQCVEVECELPLLMAEDSVTIEISSYIAVGSFQFRSIRSLIIESSMALYTDQENVMLNNQPLSDDGTVPEKPTEEETSSESYLNVTTDGTNSSLVTSIGNKTTPSEDDATVSASIPKGTDGDGYITFEKLHKGANSTHGTYAATMDSTVGSSTSSNVTSASLKLSELTSTSTTDVTSVDTSHSDTTSASSTETTSASSTETTSASSTETTSASSTETTSASSTETTSASSTETTSASSTETSTHINNSNVTAFKLSTPSLIQNDSATNTMPSNFSTTSTERGSHVIPVTKTEGNASSKPTDVIKGKNKLRPIHSKKKRKYAVSAATYVTIYKKHEDKGLSAESLMEIGLWKLILAIVGGLMLIIILCAILYKIGFFKRNRISAEEREELAKKIKRRSEYEKYYGE